MASTGEVWKLGHRPALDGLRGIAVGLVVLAHVGGTPHGDQLGQIGVSIFFTLSGFLIVSLLLEERARSGRVNMRGFWLRRARRLVPALAVFLTICSLLALTAGRGFATWEQILAAATYTTNWFTVATGGPHGALSHTWSLAVEEQFYLAAPLLAILAVSRRRLLVVAAVGIAASLVARGAVAGEEWRIVHGLDTRAGELLAGVVLAAALHKSRRRDWSPLLALVALMGVGACVLLPWPVLLGPGLVAVSAFTCLAMVGCVQERPAGWLAARPLRWAGERSYGIYLWHHLVSFTLLMIAPGSPWLMRLGIIVGVAVPVAAASYRYVERPLLRGRGVVRSDPRGREGRVVDGDLVEHSV